MYKLSKFTIFLVAVMNMVYLSCSSHQTNCTNLRNNFSVATSAFILCAIINSRPITMCENCISLYINVTESYKDMSRFTENGTVCIDKYINLDRLQIVQTLYRQSFDLWAKAKCYECYQDSTNGTLEPIKSNETKTFLNYYNQLISCINKKDIHNDTTLCNQCMENYLKLDQYFVSISNENEKIGVCMDLVDMMNTTRYYWSDKCCKFRRHSETVFVACTVTVLALTPIFYFLTKLYSDKTPPTILPQRRFAESLGPPFNSSE